MTPADLRATRKSLGLTQIELAARLGITSRTLRDYEKGNAPVPLQTRLAVQFLALEGTPPKDVERGEE